MEGAGTLLRECSLVTRCWTEWDTVGLAPSSCESYYETWRMMTFGSEVEVNPPISCSVEGRLSLVSRHFLRHHSPLRLLLLLAIHRYPSPASQHIPDLSTSINHILEHSPQPSILPSTTSSSYTLTILLQLFAHSFFPHRLRLAFFFPLTAQLSFCLPRLCYISCSPCSSSTLAALLQACLCHL